MALHVRPEHVHGLVKAGDATAGRVMGDWKRYCSRALRLHWPHRQQFWTGGGSTRRVKGSGLNRIVGRILDEQGTRDVRRESRAAPLTLTHRSGLGVFDFRAHYCGGPRFEADLVALRPEESTLRRKIPHVRRMACDTRKYGHPGNLSEGSREIVRHVSSRTRNRL
ncbi:MAG: hypothetical protein K2X03_19245 [Bryobacteraceae bacterium]|nr:hypothetical protein [Bryobacteraceae bacterium]